MIRVVGDVHGKIKEYKKVIQGAKASVQVGDLGFDYSKLTDPDMHKFVGGNHDNYDEYYQCKSALGDYGEAELNEVKFFFIRGSFSIDCLQRVQNYALTQQKTWWYEEELSIEQLINAIDLYTELKPDFVITHDCPSSVKDNISRGPQVLKKFGWPGEMTCRTQQALSVMFQEHQPKLWIFGHWHHKKEFRVNNTRFICLPELGFVNVDKDLKVYP
jgi:predicted phosphodiesterase